MSDYDVGHRITVNYTPSITSGFGISSSGAGETELVLEIIHTFKPFTMSVVCHVRIISPHSSPLLPLDSTATYIVKLFDRRYITNTRETYDNGKPYSSSKEEAYQRYLLQQDPRISSQALRDIFEIGEEGDDGGMEACIEEECCEMRENEVRAYTNMANIQGTHIPKLHVYAVQGLLLEYIPSTTLKTFLCDAMNSTPIPYARISAVCDQALQLIIHLDDFRVLNKDMRLENVLVSQDTSDLTPDNANPLPSRRCVAIDFACSRLRYDDETDEQWRRAKECTDEIGAIGSVAGHQLRRMAEGREAVDGQRLWRYTRITRWNRALSEKEQQAYMEESRWGLYEYEKARHVNQIMQQGSSAVYMT